MTHDDGLKMYAVFLTDGSRLARGILELEPIQFLLGQPIFALQHQCTFADPASECFAAFHAAVRDRMYWLYSWLVFNSGMT